MREINIWQVFIIKATLGITEVFYILVSLGVFTWQHSVGGALEAGRVIAPPPSFSKNLQVFHQNHMKTLPID